ncbi:TrkH family potassium uptake protein [Salisediminibacterium halotolerans]
MAAIKSRAVRMAPPQILALTFFVAIVTGTFLLSLPVSVTEPISFTDALFTATSATTVTGLVVVSTGNDFTAFGQIVIMILMKIGGLGLMTFAVLIVMVLGKKIGLRERMLIQASFNQPSIGGIIRLVKVLIIFAFSLEITAAAILAITWIPEYGWKFGTFTSVFHAISAFNNAGFSLWDDSLMAYAGDPVINILITFLFIAGGLGFTVLYDLAKTKNFHRLSLHSKVMLAGTLATNIVALFTVFFLEYANPDTLGTLSGGEKVWTAYFQAVTPRTAGFNTLDIGSMEPETLMFMLPLMFIGAGSASTGSGIKLTTFLIIVIAVIAYLKGKDEAVIYNRSVSNVIILRSLSIMIISITAVFLGIFSLSMTEEAPTMMIIFETFSAFGTVGLSMGLTDDLSTAGKYIVMILMFVGRVGPVTLAFALSRSEKAHIRYPKGDIFTG